MEKKTHNIKKVCINDNCFIVEMAITIKEKQTGLMNRESLPPDSGMLFIYEEENIYPFWMKNTLIPLDIIWINKNKEIIYIENNALPCKLDPCPIYNPKEKAIYILEINGKLANSLKINIGDKVILDL